MTELERLNESLKKVGESLSGVSMQGRISCLERELKDKQCKIEEMQHYIDCLKAKLAEAQGNKTDFPNEPIKVAEMLIDASYSYKHILTGKEIENSLFSKSDLRQIAEHLLVYCNNAEDD